MSKKDVTGENLNNHARLVDGNPHVRKVKYFVFIFIRTLFKDSTV